MLLRRTWQWRLTQFWFWYENLDQNIVDKVDNLEIIRAKINEPDWLVHVTSSCVICHKAMVGLRCRSSNTLVVLWWSPTIIVTFCKRNVQLPRLTNVPHRFPLQKSSKFHQKSYQIQNQQNENSNNIKRPMGSSKYFVKQTPNAIGFYPMAEGKPLFHSFDNQISPAWIWQVLFSFRQTAATGVEGQYLLLLNQVFIGVSTFLWWVFVWRLACDVCYRKP